uniref:Uncharacterized protein MANES_13G060800 n=1 Tax=Rhizophora mucronata TaxID=61149 RepID=A0A2P2LIV9_RHIMU
MTRRSNELIFWAFFVQKLVGSTQLRVVFGVSGVERM